VQLLQEDPGMYIDQMGSSLYMWLCGACRNKTQDRGHPESRSDSEGEGA
jgi:hypothetical protein